MEVGCLRNPGASTIGSQLLDGAQSHGRQILETKPRREGRVGMLEDVLPCKTMLTVNAIAVKAANMF